jgi:hypothetical protein
VMTAVASLGMFKRIEVVETTYWAQ